jgi:glyoxylase-like metal-dependent hydrolase (beta-lactamase superfamily II)
MKKILLALLILVVLAAVLLGSTFTAAKLDLALADPTWDEPRADPPEGMRLAVLSTGEMLSKQGFSFRGGDFGTEYVSGMDVVLIEHPGGSFLLDTGFGRDVDRHAETMPFLMRNLANYRKNKPAADRLLEAGYSLDQVDGILLSHSHWDHVSGIPDFPGVPVWVNQAERDFIAGGAEMTALVRSFPGVDYHVYDFDGGEYLGFEKSHDVFGDGSVVVVAAGGHTPGSVVTFVTLPSRRRYAFVGDLVWAHEGIEIPAERPWLARWLVDYDAAVVRREVVHLHKIHEKIPDMVFVPAHDRRVFATMAAFPDFES